MMNCKHAQSTIALAVGDDLDGESQNELTGHLARCPECRAYQREMQGAMRVLQTPARQPAWSSRDSVWPEISSYLAAASQPASLRQQFNGWLPALTVIAACSLMLIFARSQSDLQMSQVPTILPQFNMQQSAGYRPAPVVIPLEPEVSGVDEYRDGTFENELSNPKQDHADRFLRGIPNNRGGF